MQPQDDLLSPGYTSQDESRFVEEAPKRNNRTAFARDRARILHSAGLRRLAAKTQVLAAGTADFPRTRLTHTLEVSQIGRELGQSLGCDPDLVEVGCLAHDLGHPPFGHNGESALNIIASEYGGFEGNAQTLRVLTRLEAKAFDAKGDSVGLNLTRASLDAGIKYPWARKSDTVKFGYYEDDFEIYSWVRGPEFLTRKSFEAQVMDWADDVAYSVHDVEDAIVGNHLDLRVITSLNDREAIVQLARSEYSDQSSDEITAAIERLSTLSYWPAGFDGSLQSLAALKNLTSQLIGRFTSSVDTATRADFGAGRLTRYEADLRVPAEVEAEVAVLKTLANLFVMQRFGAEQIYQDQQAVLFKLADLIWQRDGQDLEQWIKPAWDTATDEAAAKRVVIDQIASLTDASAEVWLSNLTAAQSKMNL
jgi:dGTPase